MSKNISRLIIVVVLVTCLFSPALGKVFAIDNSTDLPPRTPQGLRVYSEDSALKIAWQENLEADLFSYQIRVLAEDDTEVYNDTVGKITEATISGLTNGSLYQVYLQALDIKLQASAETSPIIISPERTLKPREYHVSAWLTTNEDVQDARYSYENNRDLYDTISPFWYNQEADGNLTIKGGARDVHLINDLKKHNITIIPTITNNYNSGNKTGFMLTHEESRARHINNIVYEVMTYGYDGIDLDYENVNPEDKNGFSELVEELATLLHEKGKQLVVTSQAKRADGNNWPGVGAMDYERLGQVVDEFRIMTYDFSRPNTEPGPIAPPDWIGQAADYAVSKMLPSKVVMGIPFYGYDWCVSGVCRNSGIVWDRAQSILDETTEEIEIKWDESGQEPYFSYTDDEFNNNVAYFQNVDSISKKLEAITARGVKGVVIWRLGSEDPKIFDMMRDQLGKRLPAIYGVSVSALDNGVDLDWEATTSEDLFNYRVTLLSTSTDGYETAVNYEVEVPGLLLNDLENDVAYSAIITAQTEDGSEITSSRVISFTPHDLVFPYTITDLAIEQIGENSVQVSWSAPGDNFKDGQANHYEIRYDTEIITNENFASANIYEAAPGPLTPSEKQVWELRDLEPDQKYYIAIKTFDEVGNVSEISNVVKAVLPDNTIPSAPTDLQIVPGDKELNLTWGKSSSQDVVGYQISYQVSGVDYVATETTNSNYKITGLKNNESYKIIVYAVDDNNNFSEPLVSDFMSPRKTSLTSKMAGLLVSFSQINSFWWYVSLALILAFVFSYYVVVIGMRTPPKAKSYNFSLPQPNFSAINKSSTTKIKKSEDIKIRRVDL
ncbi:MAG: glycosyl hydrolase family 18 protein [bacterium]